MTQRTSIFDTPVEPKAIDISDFSPAGNTKARPKSEEIDAVSAGSRFKSREAPAAVDAPETKRQPMVYRTGRNVTFSAKTTRQTVDEFYALAEENGWKAGETFEKAVAALRQQYLGSRGSR